MAAYSNYACVETRKGPGVFLSNYVDPLLCFADDLGVLGSVAWELGIAVQDAAFSELKADKFGFMPGFIGYRRSNPGQSKRPPANQLKALQLHAA